MAGTGAYSLWIEPPGFVSIRLDALIEALAARSGGPAFSSHITLLGGLAGPRLSDLSEELASRVPAFDVKPAAIGTGGSYHHCVFMELSRTQGLMHARALAERTFLPYIEKGEKKGGHAPFEPHLSLVYGDLDEAAKKDLAAGLDAVLATGFRAEALSLWDTGGPPSKWRRVGGPFELGG